MSSKITLDSKGLVLAPGELTRAAGSLIQADNVNVEAPGVIRSRFGFARQANGFGGPAWKFITTKELGSNLLMNTGSATAASGLRYGDGSVAPTSISGTVTNQPDTRMQAAVSRRNHYLTSDEGVRRLESDYSLSFAGMPKGLALDLTGPTNVLVPASPGVGVVVADQESVAYRQTWCKADAQGIVMEGSPALSRTVVRNNTRTTGWATGEAKNVTCRILIPKQILTASTALTTSYFYRLYRSRSEASGIVPGDDMALVAEAYLTAGNISAGYVEIVDSTPESFRALAAQSSPLYTNPNLGGENGVGGPGLKQSNDAPPRARDVVLFAECLFYSDLVYLPEINFTILSVVAGTGLTAADTITIGGIVYTAVAEGATPGNNEFRVIISATASENIERTARNLIEAVNKSTTNTTTWASYASSPSGLPGQVHVEARTYNGFTAVASAHGTGYRPSLAVGVASTADTFANGYAFSKPAQGDAVPAINVGFLGRDDTALLRQVVLRDSIYQFTDSGIYRLTGRSFEEFSSQEFDLSFRLIGREMVVVCDDYIYAWGYEGIARISSAGVEYISNAIEPLTWQLVANVGLTWFGSYAYATAYRSRHKVLFFVPTSSTSNNKGNCPTALVYDTRMQAWTQWQFKQGGDASRTQGHSCGSVRVSDDLLFMGQWNSSASDSKVFKERRDYLATDFKDDTYDGTDVSITKTVKWSALTASPEKLAHWQDLYALFDVSPTFTAWTTPTALTAIFTADYAAASSSQSMTPTAASRISLCSVPKDQRVSARLTVTLAHAVVGEYFGLEGLVLVYGPAEGVPVRT